MLVVELDVDHPAMGTGADRDQEAYDLLRLAADAVLSGPGLSGMKAGDSPVPIMLNHVLVGQAYITERNIEH